jgi:hypothetical protein
MLNRGQRPRPCSNPPLVAANRAVFLTKKSGNPFEDAANVLLQIFPRCNRNSEPVKHVCQPHPRQDHVHEVFLRTLVRVRVINTRKRKEANKHNKHQYHEYFLFF